jgi:type II secretory pathway component PulF
MLHRLPILGQARRAMALARLTMALEALLNAGVNVLKSWELAAAASGSPALTRAVARALPAMVAGETPGEAIAQTREFPAKFLSLYRSGEISGRIDQSLKYLYQDYTDESARLFRRLAEWTPRLVFLLIAGMIGYFVITFYLGYFGGMLEALDRATQGQ